MINLDLSFLFVQIPKTAGSSISTAIGLNRSKVLDKSYAKRVLFGSLPGEECYQHLTPTQLVGRGLVTPEQFNSCFKFAFVRNPWDRLVSEFHHRNYSSMPKFLNKVQAVVESTNGYGKWWNHLVPQVDFIYEANGKVRIDFIGRYESLQSDFQIVCDKLSLGDIVLPHERKSKRKPYQSYFNAKSKLVVSKLYEEDLDTFKYVF